jgi:hypothetical protein
MQQTTITPEEFAELVVDLEVRHKCDLGGVLSLTGRHPDLGAVVAVQDGVNVFVLTERPLSCPTVPDTYVLETAIARTTQERSSLEVDHRDRDRDPTVAVHGTNDGSHNIPTHVRGMLTWLGLDPRTATRMEVAYAREAFAHAREMAALSPAKLAELRAALLADLRKLAA